VIDPHHVVQRICLVSGGTGGHLVPALVLARGLGEAGHVPVLVTEGRDVERELLRRELPDVDCAELPPPRRRGLFAAACWLPRAVMRARRTLRERGVDAVVSTGGRPSFPVGLAAKSLGLPLYLLEQNAVVGRVNRWLMPFARRIYLGLPLVRPVGERGLLTGTPLREGFRGPVAGPAQRAEARRQLGFGDALPLVAVTGGSQGARSLNEVVPRALAASLVPMQVVHLSGLGQDGEVRRGYAGAAGRHAVQVRPVATDIDRLFAAADLVLCRGGGTTVAELAAAGRPAVIVPYPHHRDRQQFHNAQVLARAGAAVVVEERDLDAARLAALVESLLRDPQRLADMAAAARGIARPDAVAAILADLLPLRRAVSPQDAAKARSIAASRPREGVPG
jgi:UDP-N-acetylglucosamine--N-acetylmuramyl-(pentapeptide) pyrophosphoryl-undecaprenol N-acetylglucosamine transferase